MWQRYHTVEENLCDEVLAADETYLRPLLSIYPEQTQPEVPPSGSYSQNHD